MSAIYLKLCDLLEFSKMCAPEYNKPEFSDRVLVFDVMRDGWETTSLIQNSSVNELVKETRSNNTAKTSNGKRNLDSTDEESQQKRKKIEPDNSLETQVESLVADCGSEMKNEGGELVCDQEEGNQVDMPVIPSSTEEVSEKSVVMDSNGIQENLRKPLRQLAIYVHSLWLAVQSSYFRSLLHSSGMKETHDKEVHLKIPESEENSHLFLLEAMYRNDVLNDKTVDELLAVLELADKYDVKFVFKTCKYILQENATTFDISTQIMHVIKVKHNMNDVEDLAATLQLVLANEFSPLDNNWQCEKFTNLSEPSVKYLLSSNDLIAQSENTVFHALMYWMEQNYIDPASLEETNDLLTVARFKLVTVDYLLNVINNHPIASKMPKFGELYLSSMTYHATPPEQKKLLKVQPVFRKEPEEKIVQFTFVVDAKDYRKTKLQSGEFWACGYKMSVDLVWNGSCLYPHFDVHNLNEESLVSLRFAVVEQHASKITVWHKDTFNINFCRKKYPKDVDNDSFRLSDGTRVFHVVVKPF